MSKWAKCPYEQIWCQMSTRSSNLLRKYLWVYHAHGTPGCTMSELSSGLIDNSTILPLKWLPIISKNEIIIIFYTNLLSYTLYISKSNFNFLLSYEILPLSFISIPVLTFHIYRCKTLSNNISNYVFVKIIKIWYSQTTYWDKSNNIPHDYIFPYI